MFLSYIYNYNNSTNSYDLIQTLTIDNTIRNDAGAITDDHMWLIYTKDSGYVHIYNFNNGTQQFELKETISGFLSRISSVSITNDHMYLAFALFNQFVYVYVFDGTNFTQLQQITVPAYRIALTDDH